VIERVYERESRGAIQGASVVKGSSDSNGCFVDIRDTKIYFPHGYMLGLETRGLGSKETKLLAVGKG
jgi:hypothetical protein